MKIFVVIGTRPEAIKMAPIIKGLSERNIDYKLCITGQHGSMLNQVLRVFDIIPDYDLKLMKDNQSLSSLTSSILQSLEPLYAYFLPDIVLVHGDTATTFAASLSAFHQRIPIGHVEAGLRTGDFRNPFPEEANRKLTSILSSFHFAPTESSKNNLLKEGIPTSKILVTGNTVIDAILMVKNILKNSNHLMKDMRRKFPWGKIVLITGHRRENFGVGFHNICNAIRILATKFPVIDFVYPVHLNPCVQKPANEILKNIRNIHLIEPQDYLPFVYLMTQAYIILTDSGGIQEEAPSLGKPVLVMRETTERPEAIAAGTAKLVGTSIEKIIHHVTELLENHNTYQEMSVAHNPYGDGYSSQKIIHFLETSKNLC